MKNLLIVIPRTMDAEYVRSLIDSIETDADVLETDNLHVTDDVKRYFNGNAGVVVAQGHLAHILEIGMSVPLVEVVLTGQDMALLFRNACVLAGRARPRIAFVGYRHMFSDPEPFEEILDADAFVYPVLTDQDLARAMTQAADDRIDVVVGDTYTCSVAEKAGFKSLQIHDVRDSFLAAVRTASRLASALIREQHRAWEIRSIIQNSSDAVIRLNEKGEIVFLNSQAEKAVGQTAEQLTGVMLSELEEIGSSKQLRRALEADRDVSYLALQLGHASYMVTVVPVRMEDRNNGWIITLQEFAKLDDMDEYLRRERNRRGFIAKATFAGFPARSASMAKLVEEAEAYAQYDVPILLTGEPRLAKSRFAECIHNASLRRKNPYVHVDIATIPPGKQFDYLFGRSNSGETGLVSQANKGTLFLLDVHALEPECQRQLLSLLRTGTFRRVNSLDPIPVSARLICSTFMDLMELARQGKWMWQLANTLLGLNLRMPPIREMPEDIPTYLSEYMKLFSEQFKKRVTLTDQAVEHLCRYPWPGNLRDIEYFCMKAIILSQEPVIGLDFVRDRLLPDLEQGTKQQSVHIVSNQEELSIQRALREADGSREKTAEALGLSRSTLWRKMKKYGIE